MSLSRWIVRAAALGSFLLAGGSLFAAEAPSVEQTLTLFRPSQRDVEFETPPAAEFKNCKVSLEKLGKTSGWVVTGPNGQVLRRFLDSSGKGSVDQWRYYNQGLEVFRDIDTNANRKADEHRWLNTGGSRWAIDKNEDGRIDAWKSLSAEEAVKLAVMALIRGDDRTLESLLATKEELEGLGIADTYVSKIVESIADPAKKVSDIRGRSKLLTPKTVWMRSDNLTPCTIPAEEGKLKADLVVYENSMAIIENAGNPGVVQVGELVKIGDVWKLTQIPHPIEGASTQVAAGGVLMQPQLANTAADPGEMGAPSPDEQKLLAELQKLDSAAPQPAAGAAKASQYNAARADVLARLVSSASSDEKRTQWMEQMINSIASAVQLGTYAEGLTRLKQIETDLRRSSPKSAMVPYAAYRRILSEYYSKHQGATDTKQQEVQKWWREELEKFAKDFPQADDTPEALLQLAIAHEFVGKGVDAKRWYGELAEKYPQSKPARRAVGALRRLDIKGKPFDFGGPGLKGASINARDYRGKVLLVVYWSTWCTLCTEDLPVLKALYEQYRAKGFEIVGVSLDVTAEPIDAFLKQHKVPWPQIYQPGGTDSEPAASLGVIVPPLMILVDRQGKVAHVTSVGEDIKAAVPELVGQK